MQVLTPMMISLSSPASINICGVSSRATPFFTRSSSAFAMMSYIRFVERILRTALGLGIHGKRTVAGVVAGLDADDTREGVNAFLEKRPPRWS